MANISAGGWILIGAASFHLYADPLAPTVARPVLERDTIIQVKLSTSAQ